MTFAISFGDGNSTIFSAKSPLVVNHVYTGTGTFTASVTATDEYGHSSKTATIIIKVVVAALETNPFNSKLTALFVGGTSGNDTVAFAPSGRNVAVTLNGVSEGAFNTAGPLIVFGQGGKDTLTESGGLKNATYLPESPTASNIETDLDNEAIQWAGLSAAVEYSTLDQPGSYVWYCWRRAFANSNDADRPFSRIAGLRVGIVTCPVTSTNGT